MGVLSCCQLGLQEQAIHLTNNPQSLPQQHPLDAVSTRTGIFLDVLNNNKTPAGKCISRVVDAILAVENSHDSQEILDTHGDDSPQVSG